MIVRHFRGRRDPALPPWLPLRQRSVLTLRIFNDLPFRDIAQTIGISENSAKVNYHHAVTRLRQWIRREES